MLLKICRSGLRKPRKVCPIMPVMSEIAALVSAIVSLIASVAVGVRWLVRVYLRELVPNGGQSIKDQVSRLERQVEMLVEHLITKQ